MSIAAKTLVVVESPAKAKTIKKYLGPNYEVIASKGHIKDLPKKLGVDVEKDFAETYEVIEGKAKVLAELKGAAKSVGEILLATDPDREGEAIAWHVAEELKRPKIPIKRVEFHEITKKGVEHGVNNPRALDDHLYDAQRARRVLDRIVGYDVSALVWSKLAFGLSAGRVQSVALRLIVDREREIEAFVPEEYWNVGVSLVGNKRPNFVARLVTREGEKYEVKDGATADQVKADLTVAKYTISRVSKREQKRHAPAPYTTSKLQQDATSYLRFTTKRTMQIAQNLYEGVDLGKDGGPVGLITYMRTDSVRVSEDAITAARSTIAAQFGADHLPEKPNYYKSKKNAQDAHEAIRPTSMELPPEAVRKHLKDEQFKLYKLIWDRFVASQMAAALYDQTSVDIEAVALRQAPDGNGTDGADGTDGVADGGKVAQKYGLRASGRTLKFGGWLEAYGKGLLAPLAGEDELEGAAASDVVATGADGAEAGPGDQSDGSDGVTASTDGAQAATGSLLESSAETSLPELTEGELLRIVAPPGVIAEQKFTQPPPRYNEGSLVRELEKRGIGRPSTYAEIISKVQARDYVEKLASGGFKPSLLGKFVVDGLVRSALDFMDPNFTAKMEEDLDEVEAGRMGRVALLQRFYKRFREQLDKSKKLARWTPEPQETTLTCSECGAKMLKRWSKKGWFLGCSAYPKCKTTQDLGPEGDGMTPVPVRTTDYKCDKCGKPMIIRTGRYGDFLSCTGYPQCKNAKPVPLGILCPKCGGHIIEIKSRRRGGKSFYGCSNYSTESIKCDFKLWQKPIAEPCPSCGAPFLTFAGGKKNPMLVCVAEGCGFKKPVDESAIAQVSGSAAQPNGSITLSTTAVAPAHPDGNGNGNGVDGHETGVALEVAEKATVLSPAIADADDTGVSDSSAPVP